MISHLKISSVDVIDAPASSYELSKKLDKDPASRSIVMSCPSFFILVTVEGVSATLFSFDLFFRTNPFEDNSPEDQDCLAKEATTENASYNEKATEKGASRKYILKLKNR